MSLDYDKAKKKSEESTSALAYISDLFAALTFIFLFLFVVVMMQNSAHTAIIQKGKDELEKKYKNRLNAVEDGYKQRQMDMSAQISEFDTDGKEKTPALYDIAKAKLAKAVEDKNKEIAKRREAIQRELSFIELAEKKIEEIDSLEEVVGQLIDSTQVYKKEQEKESEKIVTQKENQKKDEIKKISKEKQKIVDQFQDKIEKLNTQIAMIEKQKKLEIQDTTETHKEILEKQIKEHSKEMSKVQKQIEQKEKMLDLAKQNLTKKQNEILKLKNENTSHKSQEEELNKELNEQLASAEELSNDLEKLKKVSREQKMQGDILDAKNKELSNRLNKLSKDNDQLNQKNYDLVGKVSELKSNIDALKDKNKDLVENIRNMGMWKQQKSELCDELRDAFALSNIPAIVDSDAVEIIIPFEDSFFDYDSDVLKELMKDKLARAIPVFAKTVFGKKRSYGISSVELIGYASPVYKGQLLNPNSLDPLDWEGMQYNMDLSYRRARSIFKFIFDTSEISFPYQSELIHVSKISGKSHIVSKLTELPESEVGKIPSYLTKGRQFCRRYDCAAWQKVSFKFEIDKKPVTQKRKE